MMKTLSLKTRGSPFSATACISAGMLVAACAGQPVSHIDEAKSFGAGGLWVRGGLFKSPSYERLKRSCTSSGGAVAAYDEEGYEERQVAGKAEALRRPALLACSSAGEFKWGISFRWFNPRMVAPLGSDQKEAVISGSATLLSPTETAALVRQIAGWTERVQQAEIEQTKRRAEAEMRADDTESRRVQRIRQESPGFRERVRDGDLCHVAERFQLIPCLVVAVKKPIVQVQVGTQTLWIRIEQLMAP